MKKEDKTNVMRLLDGKKIPYEKHTYEPDAAMGGEEIADILGEDPDKVFKTLVTQGRSGAYYIFVVPVCAELDLKKAAKASGEKAVSMIKQKERLPLTGYVHGGCSPIGMKKQYPTFIHETAIGFDQCSRMQGGRHRMIVRYTGIFGNRYYGCRMQGGR